MVVWCFTLLLQVRKQAEDAIKQLTAQAAVVPELLACIQNSASAEARQLAAVLLRKHITKHWKALPAQVRSFSLKALLPACPGASGLGALRHLTPRDEPQRGHAGAVPRA